MALQNNQSNGLNCKQLLLLASSLGIISASSVAHSALFDCVSEPGYCIGVGDTVIFKYVGTSSSIGLFGTVEVIGDSIVSFPTAFRAEAADGASAFTSDNGTVQVIAKQGYQIDGVNVLENGDYLLNGAGASVDVDGWAKVLDWNNLLFGASIQQNLTITGDLTINDSNTHNWTGATAFDIAGSSLAGIDHIGLQLQNNLYASTTSQGESAWIEKKIVGGSIDMSIITTPVPVPAAVWLFGSGLIGLVGIARRRARA